VGVGALVAQPAVVTGTGISASVGTGSRCGPAGGAVSALAARPGQALSLHSRPPLLKRGRGRARGHRCSCCAGCGHRGRGDQRISWDGHARYRPRYGCWIGIGASAGTGALVAQPSSIEGLGAVIDAGVVFGSGALSTGDAQIRRWDCHRGRPYRRDRRAAMAPTTGTSTARRLGLGQAGRWGRASPRPRGLHRAPAPGRSIPMSCGLRRPSIREARQTAAWSPPRRGSVARANSYTLTEDELRCCR
jgi:hypothetical protein